MINDPKIPPRAAVRDHADSVDTLVPCPVCIACKGCGGPPHMVTRARARELGAERVTP